MATNYKQCPNCGSKNSLEIIYGIVPSHELFEEAESGKVKLGGKILNGMQTHEAFLLSEEGKIKLGGSCIIGSDPKYYCKDCENEWDRQDAIDQAYKQIKGIKTSVGGYFGGHFEVVLDFESRKLKWSQLGARAEDYYEKTIRQSTLDRFIEDLKMLNLLNWKSKYIEPDICDGTHWSVEIVRTGRNVRKYGNNKFPDEWDELCKTVSKLSGRQFR